jgi:hypothetical protein
MEIEEVTLKSGRKFYVKDRGKYGVGIVNPLQKDLTKPLGKGNISWKHLFFGGSFTNFLFNSSYWLIIYLLLFAYWHDTREMKVVYEHPACFVESHLQSIGLNSTQCVRIEKAGNYTSNLDLNNLNISIPKG